jgi:peptidoglycan/LPS O-acetylase OafA/YrhL
MDRLGHVRALDGIRGLAIAVVVGAHYFGEPSNGALGVDLFFVLSGFLITTLLLEESDLTGRISFARFYERRARRLLPALALVLGGFLVVDWFRHGDGLRVVALYGLYFGNVYQAFWRAHSDPLVGLNHLWSLAEEEQFYLLSPLAIVLLIRVRSPARWLLTLASALAIYRAVLVFGLHAPPARVSLGPDTRADGLVLGSALAFWRFRGGVLPDRSRLPLLAAAAAALLLLMSPTTTFTALGLPVFECAAAIIVIVATTDNVISRCLSVRPLVWLGAISYSLYLWHPVVIWTLHRQHRALALAIAVALSYASTRWIEAPLRRWRRTKRRRPELADAAWSS